MSHSIDDESQGFINLVYLVLDITKASEFNNRQLHARQLYRFPAQKAKPGTVVGIEISNADAEGHCRGIDETLDGGNRSIEDREPCGGLQDTEAPRALVRDKPEIKFDYGSGGCQLEQLTDPIEFR